MARRTTAEGGLARQTREEEALDLRAQEVALLKDLAEADAEVKRLKGELAGVRRKKDWAMDNWRQPDLPFPEAGTNGHAGNGQGNGEYTP
jgi:hypothetical protein